MAEQNEGQEKTEEPTSRRLEQAREQGQVPRSRELTTTALLLAAGGTLMLLAPFVYAQFIELGRLSWQIDSATIRAPDGMFRILRSGLWLGVLAGLPVVVVVTAIGIASVLALGGVSVTFQPLMPKLSRIDPIAGIGRIFSMRSLVELLKAILKLFVVGVPVFLILSALSDEILALDLQHIDAAIMHAMWLVGWGFLGMAAATIIIALVDVPWQLYDFASKMKMSLQEIKEEMKDTDGRPEVKQRIRRLQQEMASRRMLADVPNADVIITNPEHYAVALKYDAGSMGAPRVLAKGADFLAARIRQAGTDHAVTIVQAPALTRAVYYSTEIGGEIPKGLYLAVARILAYVMQLNRYRKGQGTAPVWPDELPIPDELRHD